MGEGASACYPRRVEIFGRYQVLSSIAKGGMAEIMLARPLSGTRRYVALKRILPSFSKDLQFVSMFIDEARITIGLNHKNVVRLDDFGQVDGVYFMAIEYVDGTDLAAVLRAQTLNGKALPPIVAAAIVGDTAAALAHAHALTDAAGVPLGVVHRDVSPQNILLSSQGVVKLTDFGIAAAKNKLSLTTPGVVLGKAAYMAPEQARGTPVSSLTDLWALGVILWECLVGDRLFAADSPIDTLDRVLNAPVPLPSSRRAGVPVALDSLTMALLSREPKDRPKRADDVARALSTVVTQLARTSSWARVEGATGAAPVFDDGCLARFLASIAWTEDTAKMRPPPPKPTATASPKEVTQKKTIGLFDDPLLKELMHRLRDEQEPWLLVDVGDRAFAIGQQELALSAWRTAAAGFASRGLLVQCLAAHSSVRAIIGDEAAEAEVMALGELEPGNADELIALLHRFDRHGLGLAVIGSQIPLPRPVPLLSDLGPRELARLAGVVGVKRVAAGEVIISEGDRGDVLYAVARGRLVVSCSPGESAPLGSELPVPTTPTIEADWAHDATAQDNGPRLNAALLHRQHDQRVFLAGLADGDFFGEFSFLAERPRSATVEAVTDAVLLEIERNDVDHIAAADPAFTAPLLAFYKERVIELMMAKSPVFSLLPPEDRRGLLDRALALDLIDGECVVTEGQQNDSLYFIRRGEVEVYRDDDEGRPIFINKLGQGQFFGEIAALRGTPRTVSVRAIGPVSLFQIEGKALKEIVAKDTRLRVLFDAMIARRSAETQARVSEHERVFFGT